MNELPNETWTSAYLDGELTPDERAQFERWLAENPAARQLLDELRGVSQSVRALPRAELGPDFAAKVLQRAERAVLLAETPAPTTTARPGAGPSTPAAGIDWARWSRPLLWSVMATAAALAIVLLSPQPDELGPVATTSPAEAPVSDLTSERGRADTSLFARDESPAEPTSPSKEGTPATGAGAIAAKGGFRVKIAANAAIADSNSAAASAGNEASPALDLSLFVCCEVTPQALERNYFAEVLQRNQVTVEPPEANPADQAAANQPPANALAESPRAEARQARVKLEESLDVAPSRLAGAAQQTVFVVEASQQQLAGVLADLQRDDQDVLSLSVDPAPQVPAQQALTNFGRGVANYDAITVSPARPMFDSQGQPRMAEPIDVPVAAPAPPLPEPSVADAAAQNPAAPAEADVAQKRVDLQEHAYDRAVAPSSGEPSAAYSIVPSQANVQQNQLRQQISRAEQSLLEEKLESLVTGAASSDSANAGKAGNDVAPLEQERGALQQRRANNLSLSRARQVAIPSLPRLESNQIGMPIQAIPPPVKLNANQVELQFEAQQSAQQRATTQELSGGGGSPKIGPPRHALQSNASRQNAPTPGRWYGAQRSDAPGTNLGVSPQRTPALRQAPAAAAAATNAAQSPVDPTPPSIAELSNESGAYAMPQQAADGDAPMVRAVFVIQAPATSAAQPAAAPADTPGPAAP